MTLKNMIELADGLTPIETEIGYYILKNQEDILELSVVELAERTYVSKSAIHRFCNKIGLKGFNELKVILAKDISEMRSDIEMIDVNYPFERKDGPQMIAKKLSKLYETAIYDTYGYMDFIELHKVAQLLHKAEVIDIYTHSHNMNVAENFQDKMLTTGKSSVECPKGFYKQRLTALASNSKHAAIILSYSGKATFVKPILKVLYQKKVPVIYVGKSGGNLYAQYVTCALTISGRENLRDRISQFSSHIAMQYMMDVVFGCIYNMDREKNIEYLKESIGFMDDRDIHPQS